MPFQWARRHEALLRAHRDWGLRGLMESHHMGWWPSVVTDLAKAAFWRPQATAAPDLIDRLARRDFGAEGAALAVAAWRHWSEAILDYVPTNEDQYGPFRVGPAYPLAFADEEIPFPAADHAHFGSQILQTRYRPHDPALVAGQIACLEAMAARWAQGVAAMAHAVAAAPPRKREHARREHGLGAFIGCCVRTAIHAKGWWQLRQELHSAVTPQSAAPVLARMRELAQAEIANTEAAIPLVEADSSLGWEPSMEYMADRPHLEWKIAQVRRVLAEDLPAFSDGLRGRGALA